VSTPHPFNPWPQTPRRTAAQWGRDLARWLLLCSVLAVALTGLFDQPWARLGQMWVYTCCISLVSWLFVESSVRLLAQALRGAGRSAWLQGWRGWLSVAPCFVVGGVLGALLGMNLGHVLTGNREYLWRNLTSWNVSQTTVWVSVTISLLVALFQYQRGRADQAAQQATEARLRLLQSQLEPHMLFNTLANLRVLIGIDPARAQAMLDALNAFLRATLDASRQTSHPLAQEFERLADYLALMQMRMGSRLTFTLDLPPALRGLPVPPLLLQPLVENAIQHGLEPARAGGHLQVTAAREGHLLTLRVQDNGLGADAPPRPPGHHGFGLTQVRERLAALGGTLQLAYPAAGGCTLTLTLPV